MLNLYAYTYMLKKVLHYMYLLHFTFKKNANHHFRYSTVFIYSLILIFYIGCNAFDSCCRRNERK